jgi:ankyrin repeat protein
MHLPPKEFCAATTRGPSAVLPPPLMVTTSLFKASRTGDIDSVSVLLGAGAKVNEGREVNGATPLIAACWGGHDSVVKMLLGAHAAVNTTLPYSPLYAASANGYGDVVSMLLGAGAAVNHAYDGGLAALYAASAHGHRLIVSVLLGAGATVNQACADDGSTPLIAASGCGYGDIVSMLLGAGAAVDQARDSGVTPLLLACHKGEACCLRTLSSYGARRSSLVSLEGVSHDYSAEDVATDVGHTDIAAWLASTRLWCTPLHHLTIIDAVRARALLRDGADLHAAAAPCGPTPLSLARAMQAPANGSPAALVLQAAAPWSPRTHSLFPAAARDRATSLMLLGHALSRSSRFTGEEAALFDVWLEVVMRFAVQRE